MRIYHRIKQILGTILLFTSIVLTASIFANENIFSPVSKSSGNALYNPETPLENQLYLGGALGYFNRPGFYGGYNRITKGNEFWGSFFLPRSEGVFGVTYYHSASEFPDNLSHGLVQLGFGKSLTENLLFGFFLNYSYSHLINVNSTISFEPSFIYSINPLVKPGRIAGIHNFYIYSSLRQINIYNSVQERFNPSFHLGLGAKLIKIKEFYAGLQVEDAIDVKHETTPIAFGINLGYSMFQVRAGYRLEAPLGYAKIQPGNITLGAGLNYVPKDLASALTSGFALNAHYAISGFETGKYEHYMGIGVIFNYADKTAPQLQVTPDYSQFSPNGDGKQDVVVFKIKLKDLSPVLQWKLVIKNARGEIVRTFEKDQRKRSVYFPLYRIFTDLFKRSEYRYIPETIIWDGTADKINSTASPLANQPSIKLPEGSYFYEMTAIDEKGMTSNSSNGTIVMDTTFPDVVLKRESKNENQIENKNGKIFLAVSQFSSAHAEESFTGSIYNDSGKLVKTFFWKDAGNLPKLFTWNGTDNQGVPVKEGIYWYELKAVDAAGNQSSAKIDHILVFWSDMYYDLISETQGLSPNGDGLFDKINFSSVYMNTKANVQNNVASWKIYLTREKIKNLEGFINHKNVSSLVPSRIPKEKADAMISNATIENPVDLEYILSWSGDKSNFLTQQTWDGKNGTGKLMSDGFYYLTLVVKTFDGSYFKSEGARVSLDTRPPEVIVRSEKNTITPDGDDIDDQVFLKSAYREQSGIKSYTLTLYEVLAIGEIKVRVPFKIWTGKNAIPDKFYINGVSDQGLGMESLKEYEYDMEVFDIYENSIKKTSGSFYTGVIVNNFGSYLKITLTGLTAGNTFSFADYNTLNHVFDVLINDYPNYRIRVEGHSSSVGDEETNIRNSEQRAKKITRYFINKGISSDRIGFQGYGKVLPLTEVESEINNYKNDRVDFILIK